MTCEDLNLGARARYWWVFAMSEEVGLHLSGSGGRTLTAVKIHVLECENISGIHVGIHAFLC